MQDKGAFYLKTEYIRAILERLLPDCDARDSVVGTAYGYMLYCNAVASWTYKQNARNNIVENKLKVPNKIKFNSKQLGKKWGKHKADYPNMKNYTDYKNYINKVFNKPDKIIYDSINKEYLYIKGKDLLRLGESGEFISLYPGAQSGRVTNAIMNGGTVWQ